MANLAPTNLAVRKAALKQMLKSIKPTAKKPRSIPRNAEPSYQDTTTPPGTIR